jgi:hypothetical protein
MAKTKEVSYSYGRTINTGDFSSSRIDVSEVVELAEGDDREEEFQELRRRVIRRLIDDVKIIQDSKVEESKEKSYVAPTPPTLAPTVPLTMTTGAGGVAGYGGGGGGGHVDGKSWAGPSD